MDLSWSEQGSTSATTAPRPEEKTDKDSASVASVRVEQTLAVDPTLTALLNEYSLPTSFYQQANAMILYTSGTTGNYFILF